MLCRDASASMDAATLDVVRALQRITDGLRGELTLMRTARSLAALDGAESVGIAHLRQVAPSALRHRLRRNPLDESGSTARVARAITEVLPQ